MGEEEYNPLAQWEDLEVIKQAEIAAKQVVRACSLIFRYYLTVYAEENICEASPICMPSFQPSIGAFLTRNSERGQRPLGSQPNGHLWSGQSQSTGPRLRRRNGINGSRHGPRSQATFPRWQDGLHQATRAHQPYPRPHIGYGRVRQEGQCARQGEA
jgi:hypothetical protein